MVASWLAWGCCSSYAVSWPGSPSTVSGRPAPRGSDSGSTGRRYVASGALPGVAVAVPCCISVERSSSSSSSWNLGRPEFDRRIRGLRRQRKCLSSRTTGVCNGRTISAARQRCLRSCTRATAAPCACTWCPPGHANPPSPLKPSCWEFRSGDAYYWFSEATQTKRRDGPPRRPEGG